MSHAEKCPVCCGKGYISPDVQTSYSAPIPNKTCHGCGGQGWVTVQDNIGLGGTVVGGQSYSVPTAWKKD